MKKLLARAQNYFYYQLGDKISYFFYIDVLPEIIVDKLCDLYQYCMKKSGEIDKKYNLGYWKDVYPQYLKFSAARIEKTEEVVKNVILDFDKDNNVVGIEFLLDKEYKFPKEFLEKLDKFEEDSKKANYGKVIKGSI